MKAIQTKYYGPTDTTGSRIVASCDGGRITMGYDHALDSDGNHRKAAELLARKLGWTRGDTSDMHSGYLKPCTHVHVISR